MEEVQKGVPFGRKVYQTVEMQKCPQPLGIAGFLDQNTAMKGVPFGRCRKKQVQKIIQTNQQPLVNPHFFL